MATKPFLSQIAVPVGTTTGDVYYPQTSLLMHFNGTNGSTTMTDNSKNNFAVTAVGNAQLSTAQSKFGGSSLYLDGTGDYLTIPSSTAFDFGAGGFTVEFWINTTQTTSNATLIGRNWGGSPYTGGWVIQLNGNSNSAMVIYWADYSTTSPFMTANTTSYRDGYWHHIAWVRSGTSFVLYIDGTSVATATNATSFGSVNKNISIGDDLTFGPRGYSGYIDELRITNGVARYTSNFTPSTTQFLDSTGDANSNVVVNSTATGFAIGTGGINGAQLAKAWVNFNGQGTVAIRDSYNVSSITDLGTGQYLVNFSTARSNANYVNFINVAGNSDSPGNSFTGHTGNNSYSQTTTYAVVASRFNGALYDNWEISSIVFSN
jgi:hypothetical protein